MASFSFQVKDEICSGKSAVGRGFIPLAWGLLLFSQLTDRSAGISTAHEQTARLYLKALKKLAGVSIAPSAIEKNGKTGIYSIQVAEEDNSRVMSLLGTDREPRETKVPADMPGWDMGAFFAGAFLACGTIADPNKEYHLEFSIKDTYRKDLLISFLRSADLEPKESFRRGEYVVYFKESEQIEDMLTLMGSGRITLELMEIKIVKELRNRVNRRTNCETANIEKTVAAAMKRCEDINLIFSKGIKLDDELMQIARLQLDNPDMSLRELSQCLDPPLSRSGVNHRMLRIKAVADGIREKEEGKALQ